MQSINTHIRMLGRRTFASFTYIHVKQHTHTHVGTTHIRVFTFIHVTTHTHTHVGTTHIHVLMIAVDELHQHSMSS
jgi:hypothetical protein